MRRALAHPGDVAVADRLSGVLTYRKLLVGTRLLSKRMRAIPGGRDRRDAPGFRGGRYRLSQPAHGRKAPRDAQLDHRPGRTCARRGKLRVTRVITSRKLIDRLGIEVPGAEYVFLEDLRGGIGKAETLATLLATYVAPHRFLQACRRVDRRRPGGGPVHLRIGKRAQGGPLEPPEPDHERAGRAARPGRDPRRCHAGLPAPLPQLRPDGEHHCSAAGRDSARVSPGPHRRARVGARHRRLPADAPGYHAYVPGLHLLSPPGTPATTCDRFA